VIEGVLRAVASVGRKEDLIVHSLATGWSYKTVRPKPRRRRGIPGRLGTEQYNILTSVAPP
jgi:hypothetical protein